MVSFLFPVPKIRSGPAQRDLPTVANGSCLKSGISSWTLLLRPFLGSLSENWKCVRPRRSDCVLL